MVEPFVVAMLSKIPGGASGPWQPIANRACAVLFGPQVVGSNFVRDALANPAIAEAIVNWPEVAWAGLDWLRLQARQAPFDEELHSLVATAEAAVDGMSRRPPTGAGPMVCPWFCVGGQVVRTVAMVARVDHIGDVTLDELRVDLLYPLDADAGRFFRTIFVQPAGLRGPALQNWVTAAADHARSQPPKPPTAPKARAR